MKKVERIPGWAWICIALLLQTFTPAVFKQASISMDRNNLYFLFTNGFFFLGLILFFSRFVVWHVVLRIYPLSVAHPLMSLSFISILILSVVWFREDVTLGNVLGAFLIVLGVILHSRASRGEVGHGEKSLRSL